MKKNLCIIAVLTLLLLLGAACKPGSSHITTITATDNGWDSQKLHNSIAKIVIEHAYKDYELKFSTASTAMNWESMKLGDVDIDIESWTDNIASFTDDVKNGDIVVIGTLLPDSRQGIYVPKYMIEGDPSRGIKPMTPGLKKVEDLKKYAKFFPDDEDPSKGRLYGATPGWQADGILYNKYLYHGLDSNYNYVRLGSEATIFASLTSAYNLGEPWLGYCYEPTWITGKIDVVLLEDAPYDPDGFLEGKTAFSFQELKIVSNDSFPAKAPEILEFLKKYKTSSELISKALAYLDDTKASHDNTAIWFLKTHDEVIDQWLPASNAKKLREYLSHK